MPPTHTLPAAPDALALLSREWVLTNGTGAYAMGTAMGAPARRYHAYLVAAANPPVARFTALSNVWERLVLNDASKHPDTLDFTTLLFRGDAGQQIFAPQGHHLLERFERGLTARWTYNSGAITFTRELFLHWKEQAATLRYRITGLNNTAGSVRLLLAPMLTLRDYHDLLRRAGSAPFHIDQESTTDGRRLLVRRGDHDVTLNLTAPTASPGDVRFEPGEHWWHNVYYPLDAVRGQEDVEDYFVPGNFEVNLPAGRDQAEVLLTAAIGHTSPAPRADTRRRDQHLAPMIDRLERVQASAPKPSARKASTKDAHQLPTQLAIAADDFVVDRTLAGQRLSTIIAGYPWFSDWGRDTFIALPGLLLTTGRHDEAKAVLRTFAQAVQDGLVPNRFDDYDETAAHYNTVDASLWYVHAARAYHEASGDDETWNTWLAETCVNIIDAYSRGTGMGPDGQPLIRMESDGLISAGTPHTQLTWMDAACGGKVFTPRPGKAVEINALWYSNLASLAEHLPADYGDHAKRYKQLAAKVKKSFISAFWSDDNGHLFDHLWPGGYDVPAYEDASIRPNQIFAASLPHSPLSVAQRKQVIAIVADRLLTPVGLRTLPVDHPEYHGRYVGEQFFRDEAYHQGTIWAWLIGPYAEAILRQGRFSATARAQALAVIQPLLDQITGATTIGAVGQLHEIYEADETHGPGGLTYHRPVGCMAQAWSVAEVLRVWGLIHDLG